MANLGWGKRITAGAAALIVCSTFAPPAEADTSPPGPVTSTFETHYGARINRDCGYSETIPGTSEQFWLFCDTAVHDWTGGFVGFVPGSTAARGPFTAGQVPTNLRELPGRDQPVPPPPGPGQAPRGPEMFLDQPSGLVQSNGQPCAADSDPSNDPDPYAASWPSGMTRLPGTNRLLITHVDLCVESAYGYVISRFSMTEYDPATNVTSAPVTVFQEATPGAQIPAQLQLAAPVFKNGYLNLFAEQCDGTYLGACTGGSTWLARVPTGERSNRSSYRFKCSGTPSCWAGWTRTPGDATSIIAGARPIGVHVDTYSNVGRNLVMIEETTIGGHYNVWEATSPTGPWTRRPDQEPDADDLRSLPGCVTPSGSQEFCRTLVGHPELSTNGQAAVSYWGVEAGRPMMATSTW